jgi:hypothetical protein
MIKVEISIILAKAVKMSLCISSDAVPFASDKRCSCSPATQLSRPTDNNRTSTGEATAFRLCA